MALSVSFRGSFTTEIFIDWQNLQWPLFLLSSAHFLANYVKNCSTVEKNSERFCNYKYIVGKVSLIHFVWNHWSTTLQSLWGGARWFDAPPRPRTYRIPHSFYFDWLKSHLHKQRSYGFHNVEEEEPHYSSPLDKSSSCNSQRWPIVHLLDQCFQSPSVFEGCL